MGLNCMLSIWNALQVWYKKFKSKRIKKGTLYEH